MKLRVLTGLAAVVLAAAGVEARADGAPFAVEVKRDIEYAKRGERAILLDAYLPTGARRPVPAVLVVHGGGWRSGTRTQLALQAYAFARAGLAAFAIDYRLAPADPWPAQIEDVRAALAWVKEHAREHGVDAGAIGAYGYSAGGHLVAMLATDPGAVRAVVAGGAPCDIAALGSLAYWLGGTRDERPEVYRDASPVAHVSGREPPVLFFHGALDLLVPRDQPERMIAKLRAAGVETDIYVVPWAGHMTAPMSPGALERSTDFFLAKLRSSASARARMF